MTQTLDMDTAPSTPLLAPAFARTVSDAVGEVVEIKSCRPIDRVISSHRARSFWGCTIKIGATTFEAFAKLGPINQVRTNPPLERYLAGRSQDGFRVPEFLFSVEYEGQKAAAWQLVKGSNPNLKDGSDVERVVRAIALMNVLTHDVSAHVPNLPALRWIQPIAARVRSALGRREISVPAERLGVLHKRLDSFASMESDLIARMQELNTGLLVHTDVRADHIIIDDQDRLVFTDWESAALGPAGSSLRPFVRSRPATQQLSTQDVAASYARAMAEHGFEFRTDDVVFAMRAQEVFWALATGLRLSLPHRIEWGLSYASKHFATLSRPAMKPVVAAGATLLQRGVAEFMAKHGGQLYQPIPHPEFSHLPAAHGPERFDIIRPHLGFPGGTAIDLGTHWGYFAMWLEDLGYKVTAVEHSPKFAAICKEVRELCGKRFELLEMSVFDIPQRHYNIVLALNLFHHFLKKREHYERLIAFLRRLDCDQMFFQPHIVTETQMEGAYRNLDQDHFVEFVGRVGGFRNIEEIGVSKDRKLYKLTRG
jgi:hypothetical protein